MTPHLTTLTDIISFGADRFPDRVALESSATPHALTYRQLWDCARRGAHALRRRGLERGDRVLLAAPPGPDWLLAFFSIEQAGLVAVPIPDGIGAALVAAVAAHTQTRVCISGPEQMAGPSTALRAGQVSCVTMPGLLDETVGTLDQQNHASDATALLAFTSGSTARPRAVALSHANIIANLRALMAARQSDGAETMLSMLPPAHLYELVVGQLAPLVVGGRIVYAGPLLPNRLVNALGEHGVTRALAVPALLEALCREVLGGLVERGAVRPACQHGSAVGIAMKLRQLGAPERERLRLAVRDRIGDAFRGVGLGGAAIGPGWPEVLALLGIGMDVGYGLTEAGPLVSLGWASNCPPGSVGRPLPGVAVRIDPHGEILVRSAAVMQGYFGDAAATSATLEDGWLRTGDRGYLDADGFLYIAGRLKEAMVTAAGDTLHPEEVEPYYASRFFAEHCVVPLRGSDGNDVPALVVVPRQQGSDEDLQREFGELRAAAPARYRVTTMVCRTEPLPRTLLGKLKRRELGALCTQTSKPACVN
ncbi:MAG TPA: class I adenylate-forming enzyme family protein [Vicinamibacterales bacterium]|nr:class I adenylate-forming enzyme family protein [Vicinamibacterales bacterium]